MAASTTKVTSIASWFGCNRSLAPEVGRMLEGTSCVCIPFAGAMPEVNYITARTINVNDIHPHLMNMVKVSADPVWGPKMYRQLRRAIFHPETLADAQRLCVAEEQKISAITGGLFATAETDNKLTDDDRFEWACAYFICSWMARHATAGKASEFRTGISTRWRATGGDSAAHFFGAVKSLIAWRRITRRCNFTSYDYRDFLDRCADFADVGIFCDPPFPDAGDGYKFSFTEDDHRELWTRLCRFVNAKVVVRYYEHELITRMYKAPKWTVWKITGGKKQMNAMGPELLITNF